MRERPVMRERPAVRESWGHLPLVFASLGHCYVHLFMAFYFVIVLALKETWALPYHELIELWTLGSLMVGLAALLLPGESVRRPAPAVAAE